MNLALAMQMQRSGLENLPPDIQKAIIESANEMDNRGYEFALKSMEHDAEAHCREVQDRASGRRQFVNAACGVGGAVLLAGTAITVLLIMKEQYNFAQMVMASGLTGVASLLGGLGLSEVARRFTRSSRS